ncbi:Gfo/Idh/MocA family oxidoreductase [Galbitalea sp. SE-J8]|uniref:Gfo/Idh/MocA family protein n=1 Tax=Galbitalea sp. SE-J8 TaxID=3054952 RepID=UPI00259CDEA5|nr:Gfo/Idh/MocA family oxidoreductase [Galbitalea sp. SE-J8]MDM4762066.1 Gfo/Idh/MocA family oxidoreductase [Galbitalea sp. SE-J8]
MSAREVGIGIIGGGLMGREIAAALERWPALVDHPVRPRLRAVCDLNPAVLPWFEQIGSVESLVTDYHDLLADDRVDVVYVAVRHDLHEQLYVDTVRAGKALLAEKPFGIDEGTAERIVEAIDDTGAFVRCSSEMPFFPGAQAALRYLASGAVGRIIRARSAFLHSSDLDVTKPINWKRQARFCGEAGVMNDLGLHAWHLPLRLGWTPRVLSAALQDIVPERPGPDGTLVPCDTWDNAALRGPVEHELGEFVLDVETKRIAPGNKNTWLFEVEGLDGGVRFSTADPIGVELFRVIDVPGSGSEQSWQRIEVGSQSAWPTVTGGIFGTGFSDAILQMWASFLAEWAGELADRFACASPREALASHRMARAALRAHAEGRAVAPV